MKHFGFFTLFCAVCILMPLSSHGYKITDQTAFTLDNTAGIYLITFKLGHGNHDIYVPITATTEDRGNTALTYALYGTDDTTIDGDTTSMVISNATIENGMYKVPAGTKKTFTLFTVFTPHTIAVDGQYRLAVTHLPFSFNETTQLQLNPSE
ncbi:MAG: hypothetical protein LR017_00310 [Candidatus Pacebacteria bacterium]|nr:hypothetical protein [Candidatus Paceibacterota bacterium]